MYFKNARELNSHQARWAQFLTCFDFIIIYRLEALEVKTDVLSRRSYMTPRLGETAFDHQNQVILGPEYLQIRTTEVLDVPTNSSFLESIRKDIKLGCFAQDVLNHIAPD
jgi:hypothetical protein